MEARIVSETALELLPSTPQENALWQELLWIAAAEDAMHRQIEAEQTHYTVPAATLALQDILIRFHSVTRRKSACAKHVANARQHSQPEEYFSQWEAEYASSLVDLASQLAVAMIQMFAAPTF